MLTLVFAMTLLGTPQNDPATFLRDFAETRRFLAGRPVASKLTPDGQKVLFLRSNARDAAQMLFELDVKTKQLRELLTPEKVLNGAQEKLSVEEKARLERMRVSARGFTKFQMSKDGKQLLVTLSSKLYVVDRESANATLLNVGEGAAIDAQFSPDNRYVGYVRQNDVYVIDLKTNQEIRVTKGGTMQKPHGLAEFVAQEEMSRFSGFWFSPDSTSIVYQETDLKGVETFSIQDPMHPENEAEKFAYPRPGKKNATVKLALALIGKMGAPKMIKWDDAAYPYLRSVMWSDNAPLTLVVQNREQTQERVMTVDLKKMTTRVLFEETDAAWVNIDQAFPHWLNDGSAFLWFTERNGTSEVELRNADGAFVKTLVSKEAGFSDFLGYDEARETVYFTGSSNPTENLLLRSIKGAQAERVKIEGQGALYETATFSKDFSHVVVTATSLRQMPRTTLYSLENGKILDLPSVAEEPKVLPNAEIRKIQEGEGLWSMILKPASFKKGQKYPVIVNVYGGPNHQEVLSVCRENLILQWLADQGFIVVKIDGRGTPRRGRAYERAIKNDFATATVADQLAGLTALASLVPEIDMTRVGVYGWSFGGYMSALLALTHGEIFKAAVSGAPVVDWYDYDTHYTERYLGVPPKAAKAYSQSSLLNKTTALKSKLLLIHGTADDNVYFFHTLKLSDALFRNGQKHEVLPLANFTHMVPDPLVTERLWMRILQHFQDNLGQR